MRSVMQTLRKSGFWWARHNYVRQSGRDQHLAGTHPSSRPASTATRYVCAPSRISPRRITKPVIGCDPACGSSGRTSVILLRTGFAKAT